MVCMALRMSNDFHIQKSDLRHFFRHLCPGTRKSGHMVLLHYMRGAKKILDFKSHMAIALFWACEAVAAVLLPPQAPSGAWLRGCCGGAPPISVPLGGMGLRGRCGGSPPILNPFGGSLRGLMVSDLHALCPFSAWGNQYPALRAGQLSLATAEVLLASSARHVTEPVDYWQR